MTERRAFVTAAGPNYLAQTKVLLGSLRQFHPAEPVYVFLAGDREAARLVQAPGIRILDLGDLPLRGAAGMLLRYGPKEFCAAVKPALLLALFARGHRTAIFLDPDMLFLDSLEPCLQEAERHALTLTPHLDPEDAIGGDPAFERSLLMAGMFNAGFLAATDCAETRRFLDWWLERLRTQCYEDPRRAVHFDQRWLDLAPAYVDDLHILRDPGTNAGYWKLAWVSRDDETGRFLVRGSPLRLFHFSGYDPAHPGQVTRFRPGWAVSSLGDAAALFHHYQQRLLELDWSVHCRRPWPWAGAWRMAAGWRRMLRAARTLRALLGRFVR